MHPRPLRREGAGHARGAWSASELFWPPPAACARRERGRRLPLQRRVLRFALAQAAGLGGAEPAVLPRPGAEGGLDDAHLAADLGDDDAGLGLVEDTPSPPILCFRFSASDS